MLSFPPFYSPLQTFALSLITVSNTVTKSSQFNYQGKEFQTLALPVSCLMPPRQSTKVYSYNTRSSAVHGKSYIVSPS